MRALLSLIALSLALAAMGCSSAPDDSTPTGTVRLFLSALERSGYEESALRDAYYLLAAESRAQMRRRAHTATTLGGRRFEPWEMFAQGLHRVRVVPGSGGFRERIQGDRATVTVVSASGRRRAEVPLVREQGRWRLVLEMPPMEGREPPATPARDDASGAR